MKPVPLIERAIVNSTKKGAHVLDVFGGSGSTLIAAARTGRIAHLVELDPRYCDVIRRRWAQFAEQHPEIAGTSLAKRTGSWRARSRGARPHTATTTPPAP